MACFDQCMALNTFFQDLLIFLSHNCSIEMAQFAASATVKGCGQLH